MAQPTPNRKPQRFALLIGIDYYCADDTRVNLSGCVNDVRRMKDVLREELNVPNNNITTVLGAKPEEDPTEWQHPTQPTRDDVIEKIKGITSSAQPGDFVYFHYSGHGCRVPTEYDRKRKVAATEDEALFLVGGTIIRDVELGALLAAMKEKGIILLAVLDCCHSGGATRIGKIEETGVRSRGLIEHPADAEWLQPRPAATGPDRNAKMIANWFYQESGYHFVAACQANQKARECEQDQRLAMGELTASLIKALGTYRTSMSTTTYRTLDNWLSIHFRTRQQHPLVFGDFDQIIFNLGTPLEFKQPHPGEATVIKTLTKSLDLDRGSADAVKIGDEYQIFPPSETRREGINFVAQVAVSKLRLFESSARLVEGKGCLDNVRPGWWARRISRRDSHATKIIVEPPRHPNEEAQRAIKQLANEWKHHIDSANVPLKLYFDGDQEAPSPAYRVRISKRSEFEILDRDQNALRSMPRLKTTDPHMAEKLIAQLTHLQMYQVVMDLKPASAVSDKEFGKKYEFAITEVQDEEYEEEEMESEEEQQGNPTLKSYDINFTNISSEDLYVTILSLSMLRGVHRAFPIEGEGSQLVEPRRSIVPVRLEIFKPDFLDHEDCLNKGNEMIDLLKVLVTLEPHNFDHFLLHDLDQDAMETSRTQETAPRSTGANIQEEDRGTRTVRLKPAQWGVDVKRIDTIIA